jgi:tetratricopeptide (TPR) repeat protein
MATMVTRKITLLATVLVGAAMLIPSGPLRGQSGEDAALVILNSARQAYNEGNYAFAADRFREFLARHSGHKEANAARFGLALSLLEGPAKQYQAAVEPLQQLAGVADFPDRPLVFFYLGYAHRGLALEAIAQATAKPNEAAQHQAVVKQRCEQAAGFFAQAVQGFEARAKAAQAADDQKMHQWEWAARSRCDWAEMLLRIGKFKEAQAAVQPILTDPLLGQTRYKNLALYHHGHAAYLQKDYATTLRSLSQLAPFQDPAIGLHTRYLLARSHHLAEERPEAIALYESVLAGFEEQKKQASQVLQNPANFKDKADEKLRLEALLRDPPPDHVVKAGFYLAVLLCEEGRFADALPRLASFTQIAPNHPLVPEARLRQGLCLVQLRQFGEALNLLRPLENHPTLGDQVLLWMARAQVGTADPGNPSAYEQAVRPGLDLLRRAADRANQLAASDPQARIRRGDILMELAQYHHRIGQYREAASVYAQVLQEKAAPDRLEEALQLQAAALHLAKQYRESDEVCLRFMQQYPQSPLLADVAFRHAENAYFQAVALASEPNSANRLAEAQRLFGEAVRRYEAVLAKFPDFSHVHWARLGLGLSLHRLGEYAKALEVLQSVPGPERVGPLASVSYLLGDCLLRTVPTQGDDALAAGRMHEQLSQAGRLLESYLELEPNGPHAADALYKLGYCRRWIAGLLAEPQERNQMLALARQAYERLMHQFPQHPLASQAVFERAKVIAQQGDLGTAMNELARFQGDPLRGTPVAPVALLHLAEMHRAQGRPAEAVKVLEQARQQHEGQLLRQPERVEVAIALRYHQGLAIRESGKLTDARNVFASITRDFGNRPEALDAAWRAGQCRREELAALLESAGKTLGQPGAKAEDLAAAARSQEEALRGLRELTGYFQEQSQLAAQRAPRSEARLRLLYEGAWTWRILGEYEHIAARSRLQQEAQKRRQEELAKSVPAGQPVPVVRPPEVQAWEVPLQPAEQKAREWYRALMAADGEALLAQHARLELAELHAQRNEHDIAIGMLREALDKEPPAELADRLRLRLGACLVSKGEVREAFLPFDTVSQGQRMPVAAEARLRAADCLLRLAQDGQKEPLQQAIAYLSVFRDQPAFQSVPGISDRGLLRLGQALARAAQWDQSRQACEILLQRFPNSPFAPEARYGVAWSFHNQRQYDQAIQHYGLVIQMTSAEVAARAQLQIGLCRLEQKRLPEAAYALLVVPFSYDYPDLSALALCEASRVLAELKQPHQAARLLERVLKDHPNSPWAEVARQRLGTLP